MEKIIFKIKTICLVSFFLCFSCFAQEKEQEIFTEMVLGTDFLETEKWNLNARASWKHLYDEIGWRRWGVDIAGKRSLKKWSLQAGVGNYYTFHKNIDNFYELRPWLIIGYKIPFAKQFSFNQFLRGEWRNFFFSGGTNDENYGRMRYKTGIDYRFLENEEKYTAWKLNTFAEWYFQRDPINGERFANSREFGLKLQRELHNRHEIGIAYKFESFFEAANQHGGNAHIFVLEYSF